MTDEQAKRMAEMESLLREINPNISQMQFVRWANQRDAILAPPPDPDALAKVLMHKFRDADTSGMAQIPLWGTVALVQKDGFRAIAAWVERDRVNVAAQARFDAFTEACDAVSYERDKRAVLNRRDGEGVY